MSKCERTIDWTKENKTPERTNVMCKEWEQLKAELKRGCTCTLKTDIRREYVCLTITLYKDGIESPFMRNLVEPFVSEYLFRKLETKKWNRYVHI